MFKNPTAEKYYGTVVFARFGTNLRVIVIDKSVRLTPDFIGDDAQLLYSRAFCIEKLEDDIESFINAMSKLDKRALATPIESLESEAASIMDEIHNVLKKNRVLLL